MTKLKSEIKTKKSLRDLLIRAKSSPEEVTKDVTEFFSCMSGHMDEVSSDISDFMFIQDNHLNQHIDIHIVKRFCFDGRRGWKLAVAYYKNKPFMIMQNAGREYDDVHNRYIIDEKIMLKAIMYLKKLLLKQEIELYDKTKVDLDSETDYEKVTNFYRQSLDSEFEVYKRY